MVDVQRLRAVLGLLDEALMLVEAREPGAAGHFQRKFASESADFLREHGAELLAIAEAYQAAPAAVVRADGSGFCRVELLSPHPIPPNTVAKLFIRGDVT